MRIIMRFTILAGLFLTAKMALASSTNAIPSECHESIESDGYCFLSRASGFTGPFEIDMYYILNTSSTSLDKLAERYFNFKEWPKYVARSGSDSLVVKVSETLSDQTSTSDNGNSTRTILNYYETEAKGPAAIGFKVVSSGIVQYKSLPRDGKSYASYAFELLTSGDYQLPRGMGRYAGPKGLKEQSGIMHFFDTKNCSICRDGEALLVYKVKMESNPSLLPRLGAKYAKDNLAAIFTGIYQ